MLLGLLAVASLGTPVLGTPVLGAQTASTQPSAKVPRAQPTTAAELRARADSLEAAGRVDEAVALYRDAIPSARERRDSATLSLAHHAVGILEWSANRYDSALVHLNAARELRLALGDREGLGRTLNSLGASYYQLGVYEPALELFVQSRELWRELRDDRGLALALTNAGKVYQDWRQFDRARPTLEEAVAVARRLPEQPAVLGYALHTLAEMHRAAGEFDLARQRLDESLRSYTSGDPRVSHSDSLSGWSLNAMTSVQLDLQAGSPRRALPLLDSLLVAAQRRGSIRGEARTLRLQGEAMALLGDRAGAVRALEAALALAQRVDQRVIALEAVTLLASVEERSGDARRALRHLRAAEALRDTIFDQATAQRIAAMESRAETERSQRENDRLRAEQREQALVIARQRTAVLLGSVILALAALVLGLLAHFMRQGRRREAALARTNEELNAAMRDVRTLSGLIPMCASCKSVRDDDGYWEAVETYITNRSDAVFSHSICQSCGPKLYGEHWPAEKLPTDPHGAPAVRG